MKSGIEERMPEAVILESAVEMGLGKPAHGLNILMAYLREVSLTII